MSPVLSELTPAGPGYVSVDRLEMLTRNLAQLASSLTEIWFPLSHAHECLHQEKEGMHIQTSIDMSPITQS